MTIAMLSLCNVIQSYYTITRGTVDLTLM